MIPLALWYAYHYVRTGFVFGNPEFFRYNVEATLHPLRILLALLLRFWQAIGYLKGEGPYQDRRSYPNPSLVISDLCEPGESGLKLLTWLRNQPSLRRMGFILYTSAENAKDADLAYALGANASVKKSADGRALVDIVKSAQLHFFRYRTGLHDA